MTHPSTDAQAKLELTLRVALMLVQQRHLYPQGLIEEQEERAGDILVELLRNFTPRPEWLENWGKESVSAAAHDPAERVRIAKLAAKARWRGHVKMLKKKVQKQYGEYKNTSEHIASLSSMFVDKGFSGTARRKSYLNGVPNLVHLHAARDIIKLWEKSHFIKQEDSYHAWEGKNIKYGRYEAIFQNKGASYKALISTKNDINTGTRIIYSIEVFNAKNSEMNVPLRPSER